MVKIANKTIDYKFRATDESNKLVLIDNSADLQLPSIEKMTDTIKGAGILGEIDAPTYGQIASMVFSVNHRADNGQYSMLARQGPIKAEISWVNDIFNSADAQIGLQTSKVFLTMLNKKFDMGKIEVNAGADGSSEFEVLYLRKLVNGKEVLLIDKLNNKFVVNGIDYMDSLRAALQ